MSFFPSGIQLLDTPDQQVRVVPASRRPDGSVRKERKVRAGYVPAEDVQAYQSRHVVDSKLPDDFIVGLGIVPKAVKSPVEQSKTAKKNARRAQKKQEKREGSVTSSVEEKKVEDAPEDSAEARRKRLKQIKKLIKDCEVIKGKMEGGGSEALLPEQIKKVERLPELLDEFEKLSLEDQP